MSPSSAALKPSLGQPGLPAIALALQDAKGQPAHPTAAAGELPARTVSGRQVVVGVTAPWHRVASRTLLSVLTPVAALAGSAGLYAWASGVDNGNYDDPQAYDLHQRNGLIGAAGLLAGVLPPLVAWGRHALQRRDEKQHLQQAPHNAAIDQLDNLVDHAIADGPLTLAGLRACIARLHALRAVRGDEVSAQDVAQAVARLARAVPDHHPSCLPACLSTHATLAQFDALLGELDQLHGAGEITRAQLRGALLALAGHLRPAASPDARQADTLARRILQAYSRATREDAKSQADASLWDRTDFLVDLCGTRCFEPQAQVVRVAGADVLGCHPQAYREALPTPSKRSRSPRAEGQALARPEEITSRLVNAPVARLKAEVARAIGLATTDDRSAVHQAQALLAILHTLAARTDLPPGAFLEGLLRRDTVDDLLQAILRDDASRPAAGIDKAALIAELPRLCQLQGTPELLNRIVQALRQLPQHALDGKDARAREARLGHWIDVACTAANARITGTGQAAPLEVGSTPWHQCLNSPAATLHQPWLTPRLRQSLQPSAPAVSLQGEPPPVVIRIQDFLNDPAADES